ncbi:MAG: Rieske (2Fe-2S) protein [Limnothrix sp. RL_2_0]|nr:Rieske (2Fe-2S) protein [Limnothrix sp. RL_2_0]
MERRQFMGLFGVGMLATSLPVVLAACAPKAEESEVTETETPITKAEDAAETMGDFAIAGTVTALKESGGISTEIGGKKVYVFQNPTDESIVALDPTCNHQGCPVKLAGDALECSCHGSMFGLDGSLTKGPATEGLALYEVKEEGDNILVKVA